MHAETKNPSHAVGLITFGSIPHKLNDFAFHHYHSSEVIINIVKDLYRGLSGAVVAKNTATKPFAYQVGVFQGDPLTCRPLAISCHPPKTKLTYSCLLMMMLLSPTVHLIVNGNVTLLRDS